MADGAIRIAGELLEERGGKLSLPRDVGANLRRGIACQCLENLQRDRLVVYNPGSHCWMFANELPPNLERSGLVRSAVVLSLDGAGSESNELRSGHDHIHSCCVATNRVSYGDSSRASSRGMPVVAADSRDPSPGWPQPCCR